MKTLHALLFAINDYPKPDHRLRGCVNDQQAIHAYLQAFCSRVGYTYRPLLRTDGEVTRQGFIQAFQHFSAAQDGDVAVLFYGGHGSRVPAPQAFWEIDPDRFLETVVCHDSRSPGGRDLTDKELGKLIQEATSGKKLHFVAVLDCCHSGTLTRNPDATPRRLPPTTRAPELDDLYGSDDLVGRGAGGKSQARIATHITLSAARPYETSNELTLGGARRGLFTTKLVETLEKAGASPLSYETLIQRVAREVEKRMDGQHPQLNAWGGFDSLAPFLDAGLKSKRPVAGYDPEEGWTFPFGSIHQVVEGGAVHLLDPEGGTREAQIDKIGPDHSTLGRMKWADESRTYDVISFAQQMSRVRITADPGLAEKDPEALQRLEKADWPEQLIQWVPSGEEAEYWVNVDPAYGAVLTRPHEDRPLFHTDYPDGPQNWARHLGRFVDHVAKVAHWERMMGWMNPVGTLEPEKVLDIEYLALEPDGKTRKLPLSQEAQLSYAYQDGHWVEPGFRLGVSNALEDRSLWVGALYFSEDFGITDAYFPMREIKPDDQPHYFSIGEDEQGNPAKNIRLELPDEIHGFGQTSILNRIKLVVSEGPIDLSGFRQEPLQLESKARGLLDLFFREEEAEPGWATLDLDLGIHRPQEGEALEGGRSLRLRQASLEAPEGFSAETVRLSSSEEATRGLGAPVPASLGDGQHFYPLDLSGARNMGAPLDVVELHEVEGKEKVDAAHPLMLRLDTILEGPQTILPVGYDAEDGFFMPLGFTDPEGNVRIEALPESEPSTARGLGKSLKIYLKQVIHTRIQKKDAPYPILAAADVDENENLSYVDDLQQIKDRVAAARSILLLVHGLIGDTTDKAKIMQRAKRKVGDKEQTLSQVYELELCFDYESLNTPIEDNARSLKEKLESVGLGEGHGKKLVLVAHSMGGLVSRWFIEREGGHTMVSHFVEVGSPNLGSPWARAYDWATFALGKAMNFLPIPGFVNEILGLLGKAREQIEVTAQQMQPDSGFLRNLNSNPPEPGIPYYLLGGDSDEIKDPGGRQRNFLKKFAGRFRGKARERLDKWLFKGDHDDIVSLESIYGVPPFRKAHVEKLDPVACHHFSYFIEEASIEKLGELLFRISEE